MSNDRPNFRGHYSLTNKRHVRRRDLQAWRFPRGIDRSLSSSRGPMPRVGFSHPKEERGMHPSKLFEILVSSKTDLINIADEKIAIRFSAKLGEKKKIELTKIAKEKGFKVLN
jgi:large subunit ribosomal protein L32e